MICPKCDQAIKDGLQTCPNCGASFAPQPFPWETAEKETEKAEKKQKNNSRLVIALSAFIGAALIVLLTVFVIVPAVKNRPTKHPDNTNASDVSLIPGSNGDDAAVDGGDDAGESTELPATESETESTAPALSVLTVPAIGSVPITVPAAGESEFINDAAEFLNFSGEIYENKQEDSYSFTAENTGEYRLQMNGLVSGFTVSVYVYDADGNIVDNEYGVSNGGGFTAHLEGGNTYSAVVKSGSGTGTYELSVGMQKALKDISGYGTVVDATEFKGQQIDYVYVPEQTGVYRFWLSQINSGKRVSMYIYDDAGYQIKCDYDLSIDNGLTVELDAGVPYTVRVKQSEDFGAYTMRIGRQMPTVDITGSTLVTDAVVFKGQKNNYSFTAAETGAYSFYITQINSGVTVSVGVFDDAEYCLKSDYALSQNEGVSVELEAGRTYTVQVGQYSETGAYTMSVGAQKPAQNASGYDQIADSVQFAKQTNVYTYLAAVGGTYSFCVEQLPADVNVSVAVYDAAGYRLCGDSGMRAGERLTAALEAGAAYEIRVQQYSGFGAYTLGIEK